MHMLAAATHTVGLHSMGNLTKSTPIVNTDWHIVIFSLLLSVSNKWTNLSRLYWHDNISRPFVGCSLFGRCSLHYRHATLHGGRSVHLPQQPWRNHLLSFPAPSPVALPIFNGGPGVSSRENFGIKGACWWVLEHFRHKRQLNFVLPLISLFLSPWRILHRRGCLWMPLHGSTSCVPHCHRVWTRLISCDFTLAALLVQVSSVASGDLLTALLEGRIELREEFVAVAWLRSTPSFSKRGVSFTDNRHPIPGIVHQQPLFLVTMIGWRSTARHWAAKRRGPAGCS